MTQCKSIKSKKHPELRCPNRAVKGEEWCAIHSSSKKEWSSTNINSNINNPVKGVTKIILITQKQKKAATIIHAFWKKICKRVLTTNQGPATFFPELAENDKDIYTYDSVKTIPLHYRISYSDEKKHIWLFDLRFLIQSMGYGTELINPFTQDKIPDSVKFRIQKQSEKLTKRKLPILYSSDILTPEQLWNQKVLNVFLCLSSHGYGVNVQWFEIMPVRAHEHFYEQLYKIWYYRFGLTDEDRERIVPGYNSGRVPLFRWRPEVIQNKDLDLRWWRKMNLGLMKTFLTRSDDKATQGCAALYILTALAIIHPRVREAFPWLV